MENVDRGTGIPERDPVERDPPGDLRAVEPGAGQGRGHVERLGEQIEDAVKPGKVTLELSEGAGDHRHRLEQHRHEYEEHNQITGGQSPGEHLHPAVEEEHRRRAGEEEIPEHLEDPPPTPGKELEPEREVIGAGVARRLAALATESADDAHPAEHLAGAGIDIGPLGTDVAVERPEDPAPEDARHRHRRDEEEAAQEHPPVDPGEDQEPADELHQRSPRIEEHREDELADAAGIVAEESPRAAGAELVDAVERKPGGVRENAPAHPLLDPLRRPRHEPPTGERQQAPDEDRGHHRDDEEQEPPSRLGRHRHPGGKPGGERLAEEDMVDGELRRGRRGELEERRRCAERHPEDHDGPIATEDPRQLEEQSRQRPLPLALGPGGLLGRIAATAAVVGKLPSTPLPLPFGWPGVAWRGAVQRRDAPCRRGVVPEYR